jgi:hypothetical protein
MLVGEVAILVGEVAILIGEVAILIGEVVMLVGPTPGPPNQWPVGRILEGAESDLITGHH